MSFLKCYEEYTFLLILGNDALEIITINVLQKFNVEEEGEHIEKFDIKTRALIPLIDGMDCFVCPFEVKGINNTFRFKQLSITDLSMSI
jgi:CBS domain-containing protein